MTVYDGIMKGLEEAIAYQQGKIKTRVKVIEDCKLANNSKIKKANKKSAQE